MSADTIKSTGLIPVLRKEEKMMEAVNFGVPGKVITFYVGGILCGIDILAIQEVNRITDVSPVPLGPDHVRGIINLRGRIVTVIDLAHRLGFSSFDQECRRGERNIIVHTQGELVGLVVEQVGEAVAVNWREMVPPPGNIKGEDGDFYKGVFRRETGLIAVLDVAAVLA